VRIEGRWIESHGRSTRIRERKARSCRGTLSRDEYRNFFEETPFGLPSPRSAPPAASAPSSIANYVIGGSARKPAPAPNPPDDVVSMAWTSTRYRSWARSIAQSDATSDTKGRVGLCNRSLTRDRVSCSPRPCQLRHQGCGAWAGFRSDPPDDVVCDAWRHGCGGRMRIKERESRKVPLRKNFDTHLRLWFHGDTRAFPLRMRLRPQRFLHIPSRTLI
jgi:hypothetical protein